MREERGSLTWDHDPLSPDLQYDWIFGEKVGEGRKHDPFVERGVEGKMGIANRVMASPTLLVQAISVPARFDIRET